MKCDAICRKALRTVKKQLSDHKTAADQEEVLNECLAPLRNMLVGIRYKTTCRVESEFTRC